MPDNASHVHSIKTNPSIVPFEPALLNLQALSPHDSTAKTHAIGPRTIESTDLSLPHKFDAAASLQAPDSSAIEKAAKRANIAQPNNPTWSILQMGLKTEEAKLDKLNQYADQVQDHLDTINQLLDLSAAVNGLKEADSQLSPEIQKTLQDLKNRGIDLWRNPTNKINKEQLSQLKLNISSQTEKSRSAINTLVTTKIGPENNNINVIANLLKEIIQIDAKLKNKINDNSIRR